MTGRRSHGRLSALNGVVHQGSVTPSCPGEDLPGLIGPAARAVARQAHSARSRRIGHTRPTPPPHATHTARVAPWGGSGAGVPGPRAAILLLYYDPSRQNEGILRVAQARQLSHLAGVDVGTRAHALEGRLRRVVSAALLNCRSADSST